MTTAPPIATESIGRGPASGRDRTSWLRVPNGVINLVVVLLIWQTISWINSAADLYNDQLIPSPIQITRAAADLAVKGQLGKDIWYSSVRVLIGLAIAAPLAIVMAVLTSASAVASRIVDPIIELVRPIPTLALLPIFILWLGVGEASKVAFIAFSAFFLVYLPSVEAMRSVEPVLLQAAGSLGLSRLQVYRHVVLPAASPAAMVGLRLAYGTAWFLVVGAEFIAANEGLGYLINFSRVWFRVSDMLVGAVLIGLLGLTGNYLLLALEKRIFVWRERS